MNQHRPSALLASAALVLGAAFVPVSAFADEPTSPTSTPTSTGAFSNDDLVAALKAAEAPTAAVSKAGWSAQGTATERGGKTVSLKAIYAVDRALASAGGLGTAVQAEHSGTYVSLSTFSAVAPFLHVHRALKAIKKSRATWVFEPEKSLDLLTRGDDGDSVVADVAPTAALADLADPTKTRLTGTPTRTEASGSTTYKVSATDLTDDGMSGTFTLTITADGVLSTVEMASSSETDRFTFTYGTQHVTLPAKRKTVTLEQLTQGYTLATLPKQVRSAAKTVAMLVRFRAHKHAVTAASIQSYAKRLTRSIDREIGLKVFTSRPIAGGAQITGTNHFTHAHVSYTVTAAGKKAVVRRA
jgi:hypothetical protein